MAKIARTIDEYIASQPAPTQVVLGRVRGAIRKALPAAIEAISYQIPAFKLHGRPVIFFAAWTHHYAVYPASARLVAAFKDELAPYKLSKGTIRFPLSARVPVALLARLARFLARESAERQAAQTGTRAATRGRRRAGGRQTKGRAAPVDRVLTAADFRDLALSLDGAEQGSHMGAVDFRVGGRIFATLASIKHGFGNLMLTPDTQAAFVSEQPDIFVPVAGGWGRMGITHIRLAKANRNVLAGALHLAWTLRVEKNAAGGRRRTRPLSR